MQHSDGGVEDLIGREQSHAIVMTKGADALLTGSAIHFELQMHGFLVARFAPGDMRGTK